MKIQKLRIPFQGSKQLKSLKFMTPYQKCVDIFNENRDSFKCDDVVNYFVGLYRYESYL